MFWTLNYKIAVKLLLSYFKVGNTIRIICKYTIILTSSDGDRNENNNDLRCLLTTCRQNNNVNI